MDCKLNLVTLLGSLLEFFFQYAFQLSVGNFDLESDIRKCIDYGSKENNTFLQFQTFMCKCLIKILNYFACSGSRINRIKVGKNPKN